MNHLSDDMIESVLQGDMAEPPHVAQCLECRRRLAEARALRGRLKGAFASVGPNEAFAAQLRRQLAGAGGKPRRGDPRTSRRVLRFRRVAWPVVLAAAAVLVIAFHLFPTGQVSAQAEFAAIHAMHESPDAQLFRDSDPARVVAHLAAKLGFTPASPPPVEGMSIRGSCVDRFCGHEAGSYVLDTPHGVISVMVTTDDPESLKLGHRMQRGERVLWACAYKNCRIVGAKVGDLSYYVVGEAPQEFLLDLLLRIVSRPES